MEERRKNLHKIKKPEMEHRDATRGNKGKIDSWCAARYGMNLYRGCAHNCVYCDSRVEKYN